MGHFYARSASGRQVLCCDKCLRSGGVRTRTCTSTVLTDSGHGGSRMRLPYCTPPALCADCYRALGGAAKVHADCAAGAQVQQVRYDAIQARLDAGEYMVRSAYGDWADWVPAGMVGVLFSNGSSPVVWALVPKAAYSAPDRSLWLRDYPTAQIVPAPFAAV